MTKYIKKNELNSITYSELAEALNKGKLVVFPTDTVYGMGANAYDHDACEKIYVAKGRPMYKPLIILISDISMLKKLVSNISKVEQKLIDSFWPGSLTIKFKKIEGIIPDIVSAGDEFVRIRLEGEGSVAYNLIQKAGVPIVAPSANLSGSLTGTHIKNIVSELDGKVDYILDCGDIESDTVSTIVEVVDEEICIIREGKIKSEELAKIAPLREEI